MNQRIRELLSNTLLFTIANLGSKILVFLMVPLYTAVLNTEEYGISDMVHTTASMLMPILTAMIAEAVLRFCFINNYETKDIFSLGVRFILTGFLVCVVLSIGFFFIPFFKPLGWYVLFIPVVFLSQSLTNLFHKFTRGIEKVKISAFGGLLGTVCVIVFNLLFLLVFKWGVTGYLVAYSLSDFIVVGFMARECHVKEFMTGELDTDLRKQMLKYSVPLIPNQISWWALSSITRYLMLGWLGVSAVGIYSATIRIPTILTVLSDIFAQAWLLSALKDYGSKESRSFISTMHSRYFCVLIIMTAVLILISHPLASILLSGDFSSYWYLIPFMFISVFWGALVGFLGSVFSAERKNSMQFVSTAVGATVAVVVTLLFLKQYGVIIAALSTMIGFFVIWLIRRIAVEKYLQLQLSTIVSICQGLLLLAEAVLVSKEMYLYATLCMIGLTTINIKAIIQIVKFGAVETAGYLKNKFGKNS